MEKKVNNITCRCEEITEQEIKDAIRKFNRRTVDEVKRLTRAGMGLCQGRTCGPLTEKIMSEETNKRAGELIPSSKRPPVRPIKIEFLAKEEEKKLSKMADVVVIGGGVIGCSVGYYLAKKGCMISLLIFSLGGILLPRMMVPPLVLSRPFGTDSYSYPKDTSCH